MHVKVWLGGEGASELGDRDRKGGERMGAVEAILRRVEPAGWEVEGATQWRHIRSYRLGAGVGGTHSDRHRIAGIALAAYEAACEVVAFVRDVDAEAERADAIEAGIVAAQVLFPFVQIIGGPAKPAIEGWIVAVLGHRDSDSMSRIACAAVLTEHELSGKHAEGYVEAVAKADLVRLPPGCESLRTWLTRASTILSAAVHGK